MAKSKKMMDAGSLLAVIAKNRHWEQRLALHRVFLFWEEVVGGDIARYAQPYVIRGEVLWVNVSESIWMQQLHLQKINLLAALNRRLGVGSATSPAAGGLSDIRFRIEAILTRPQTPPPLEKPSAPPLAPERVEEFTRMLSAIDDQELQAALQRCWLKIAGLQR